MSYELRLHSEAKDEHARTIAWLLEHASRDRATAYATAIDSAIDELRERPLAWPQSHGHPEIRVRHLPAISYSIIYRVRGHAITIIAFAHMHRAPSYWLDRIR